jgi:hypothetical protein
MAIMRVLLIIILFSFSIASQAQKLCDDCCLYKEKYLAQQRLHFYPFNVADIIKIVSFRYHWDNYHFSDSGLTRDSLVESITLSHKQVDSLTDILFNNFRRKPSNIGTLSMCFEPRNAILFIDKNGKIIDNILICFHCSRIEVSFKKMYNFDQCSGKMVMILNFFKKLE